MLTDFTPALQSLESVDRIIQEAKTSNQTPFDADAEDLYIDESEEGYLDEDADYMG